MIERLRSTGNAARGGDRVKALGCDSRLNKGDFSKHVLRATDKYTRRRALEYSFDFDFVFERRHEQLVDHIACEFAEQVNVRPVGRTGQLRRGNHVERSLSSNRLQRIPRRSALANEGHPVSELGGKL